MNCPDCGKDIEDKHDTTYSNINTERVKIGQHTGDIYWCDICEQNFIDCFITEKIRVWNY